MSKRMFCVSFLLSVIGLFSAMTFPVNGQKISVATQSPNMNAKNEFTQKYKDISALTISERKTFFRDASAKDKSNLWKLHLALYLVKRPNLNDQQRELISEVISIATPELFEMPFSDNSPKAITLQSLTQRALGVFPKKEAAEIFANLGGGSSEIDLLQKYQDISAHSMPKRKSLFRDASAKDKSDLWRVHLALYLVKRPELSNDQREFLMQLISFVSPEVYEFSADNLQWKTKVESPLKWLLARALSLFSKQETAEFFTKLGEEQSVSVNYLEDDGPPIDLPPNTPACQCHRGFGDLCDEVCVGTSCRKSSWGCGLVWAQECNGAECL